jgi:hypothetical protein
MTPGALPIPRREIVTLLAYLETGSHKGAAHRLGISESTSRRRISLLLRRVSARNAAQAVWKLRNDLTVEQPRVSHLARGPRAGNSDEADIACGR